MEGENMWTHYNGEDFTCHVSCYVVFVLLKKFGSKNRSAQRTVFSYGIWSNINKHNYMHLRGVRPTNSCQIPRSLLLNPNINQNYLIWLPCSKSLKLETSKFGLMTRLPGPTPYKWCLLIGAHEGTQHEAVWNNRPGGSWSWRWLSDETWCFLFQV